MKTSELRQIIKEEVRKVLKEEDSFGSEIEKIIKEDQLRLQRMFIAWAKAEAKKQNMSLNFNGDAMVTVSLSKLERKGILTPELLKKWKSSNNELLDGLAALLSRYTTLRSGNIKI